MSSQDNTHQPTTIVKDTCDDVPDLKDSVFYFDDIDSSVASVLSGFAIMAQTYITEVETFTKGVSRQIRSNVIMCGLDIVRNSFNETLMYTRSLLVACQITRHAMSLYFEFVSQITDGQFKHIQLSVRDTMMFVYKQTIFRIRDDKKSSYVSSQKESSLFSCLLDYESTIANICRETIYALDDAVTPTAPATATATATTGITMGATCGFIHSLDDYVSRVLVYDTDCESAIMKSIEHVTEHLIRNGLSQEVLNEVLIRLLAFYRHKAMRGIMTHDYCVRVIRNCKDLSGIRCTTPPSPSPPPPVHIERNIADEIAMSLTSSPRL